MPALGIAVPRENKVASALAKTQGANDSEPVRTKIPNVDHKFLFMTKDPAN